jgi:hypothetical protein
LYSQKLVTQNRVMPLRREAATMRGALGQVLPRSRPPRDVFRKRSYRSFKSSRTCTTR